MDAHLIGTTAAVTLLVSSASSGAEISDPTQPPKSSSAPAPAPTGMEPGEPVAPRRLQMILRSGESRTAIVDGRALRVGESLTVDGAPARVVRITEGAVVLRYADQKLSTLELVPQSQQSVRCTRAHGTAALPCASAPELSR